MDDREQELRAELTVLFDERERLLKAAAPLADKADDRSGDVGVRYADDRLAAAAVVADDARP
jgi:hypothetical protein